MDDKNTTTVKHLITALLELPMDKEVLVDESDDSIFFMLEKDAVVKPEVEQTKKVVADKATTKIRRGRKPILSAADKLAKRREQYDASYGATAFKYPVRHWTREEEILVMSHPEDKDMILSEIMHRSLAAIHTRRWIIRKREGKA